MKELTTRAVGLYRSILKAHRAHLPVSLKELGDTYVKAEFALQKKATTATPEQVSRFLNEWDGYLAQIKESATRAEKENEKSSGARFGVELAEDLELTDEQKAQLSKLHDEASKASRN